MATGIRAVAQFGSALRSGRRGRGFESRHPDSRHRRSRALTGSPVGALLRPGPQRVCDVCLDGGFRRSTHDGLRADASEACRRTPAGHDSGHSIAVIPSDAAAEVVDDTAGFDFRRRCRCRTCSGGRCDVVVEAEHVGGVVGLLDACQALVAFRAVDCGGVGRFFGGEVVHQPPVALPWLHAVE